MRRPTRPELPLGQDETARYLPWLYALMVCITALAGIGLIVLDDTLRSAELSLGASLTLQVPADASAARLETILAALRQTHGVRSAHLLDSAETARLLEPVIGSTIALRDLPVPRLIEIAVDPDAALDFTILRQHIVSVEPEALFEDHRAALVGVRAAGRRLDGVLTAAVAIALLLIATTAGFAARIAFAARRPSIELLHRLGATDGDIIRPLALASLRHALSGGAVGAAAAFLAVVALGRCDAVVQLPAPVTTMGIADWRLWAALAASILAAAIIATASTRVAAQRRLADLP